MESLFRGLAGRFQFLKRTLISGVELHRFAQIGDGENVCLLPQISPASYKISTLHTRIELNRLAAIRYRLVVLGCRAVDPSAVYVMPGHFRLATNSFGEGRDSQIVLFIGDAQYYSAGQDDLLREVPF